MLFFPGFLTWKVPDGNIPPSCMQVAAVWVRAWTASLFPVQTETTGGNGLLLWVDSLWSLKVTETQLRPCWDWTFQVEGRGAKPAQSWSKTSRRTGVILQTRSSAAGPIQTDWFPQTLIKMQSRTFISGEIMGCFKGSESWKLVRSCTVC